MKKLILLAVLVLCACDSSLDPLSVKELVVKDCKPTGQSFVNNDTECVEWGGRVGCPRRVDKLVTYYVYDCGGERKLSLFKLDYKS